MNSSSRRPLRGAPDEDVPGSCQPNIKRCGPGPALLGPSPTSRRATSFNAHTSPVSGKTQVSQRKPTFRRAPHTLWLAGGPRRGSGGGGGARGREQEVQRRLESQGHWWGEGATRHRAPGAGADGGVCGPHHCMPTGHEQPPLRRHRRHARRPGWCQASGSARLPPSASLGSFPHPEPLEGGRGE